MYEEIIFKVMYYSYISQNYMHVALKLIYRCFVSKKIFPKFDSIEKLLERNRIRNDSMDISKDCDNK